MKVVDAVDQRSVRLEVGQLEVRITRFSLQGKRKCGLLLEGDLGVVFGCWGFRTQIKAGYRDFVRALVKLVDIRNLNQT